MKQKLFFGILLASLGSLALAAQQPPQKNSSTHQHFQTTETAAQGDKTFRQLMDDAMNTMNQQMGAAMSNRMTQVDADREFVNMMIPHHHGAIDMAKAVLLYGKDPQMRRLAQEIVTDQESEIQLMQLWLKQHGANSQDPARGPGLETTKN